MNKMRYEELLSLAEKIMVHNLGYSESEASIAAKVLVEADARGIPSHGVARLKFYKMNIDRGFAFPGCEPEIVHETPLSLVIDGHSGIGPYIAKFAVDRCIEKAKKSGTASCVVRNSNHYGIAGYWAELAAKEGAMGLSMTNTRRCCIVTHGKERLLGTNPLACAIPGEGEDLFLLDMATPVVAHGKVEVYDRRKKDMPLGWVVDERGTGTTDASHIEDLFQDRTSELGGHLFLGGEGETLGGHKGYGLGMMVELMCSALSMGRWSPETFSKPGEGSGITHYFSVTDLNIYGNEMDIKAKVSSMLSSVRDSERAEGAKRIYTHGEKEAEARKKAIVEGISLDDATVELLRDYCRQCNLIFPDK